MNISIEPICIEPGFKIYYFDMVYSYPQVLEIDFLVAFRGGILLIELERELKNIARKSLKYFTNGLTRYPVIYIHRSMDDESLSNQNTSAPVVTGNLILEGRDFFETPPIDIMQIHNIKEEERAEVFSVDNFLCSLLMYGAPNICERLLTDVFIKHVIEFSNLIQQRVKVINEVKRLKINFEGKYRRDRCGRIRSSRHNSTAINARAIVTFIPKLENEGLRTRIANCLKNFFLNPSLKEVIILHTEKSCEHARDIVSRIKGGEGIGRDVRLEFIKVDVSSISTKIRELVDKEFQRDAIILIVGEFPKRELLKLIEVARSHSIECRSLIWRPKQEPLGKVIKNMQEKRSLEGVEDLELRAVPLY